MAKTARNLTVVVAAMAAVMAAPHTSLAADASVTNPVPMSHIRTRHPKVAAAVRQAFDRSATFRKLVATIDGSDSYVYVEAGQCRHGVRACFVSVTASHTDRFMRVVVPSTKSDLELIELIAHELKHATEVIAEPWIRSTDAKYHFYERTAIHAAGGTHETIAAITAGETVRSEVKKRQPDRAPY